MVKRQMTCFMPDMALCWATATGCSQLPSAVVTGCSQFDGHRAICSRFCQQPSEAGQRASSSCPPGLGRNQSDCSDLASAAAVPDCTAGECKWSPALQCFHSWRISAMATAAAAGERLSADAKRLGSVSTPESSTMHHMASAMATAMMTPFLQILEQQQERQQEERRLMLAQMERMDRRLQCIEGKLDSNASFYPLMALAMAQLSQQTHALAQYLTVGYSSSAAPLSPAASPRAAILTPDKKRLTRQANARELAKKQVANVQQRMDQQGQASMPSGAAIDGVQALSARAVLSRPPVNGVQTVYPGSAGEAYWCKWEGRYDVTSKPSAWLHTD